MKARHLPLLLSLAGVAPATAQDLVYRLPYATPPRAIGDFDGDGTGDVQTHLPTGELVVLAGRTGVPLATVPEQASGRPLFVADLGGAQGRVVFHSTGLWTSGTIDVRDLGGQLRYGVAIPPNSVTFGLGATLVDDWSGDGVADFVVADANVQLAAGGFGRLYVFSGADGTAFGTIEPANAAIYFGSDALRIADTNGDGRDDLVVAQRGRVDLHAGGTGAHLRQLGATDVAARFGARLAIVPDADGDGVDDVAVSAFHTQGQPYVQLISGGTGSVLYHWQQQPSAAFGAAITGLPDIDGDGAGELAVGALERTWWPSTVTGSGYVRVISGRTGGGLFTLRGSVPGQAFGYGLACAGDVTGDGIAEIGVSGLQLPHVDVYSGAPLALVADCHVLPAAAGGTQVLAIRAGAAHAGGTFLVLGSASGTLPGVEIGALTLPLNADDYTLLTAGLANGPHFQGTFGALDDRGAATAWIVLPALPAALGVSLAHAAVVASAASLEPRLATNAVPLTLQ